MQSKTKHEALKIIHDCAVIYNKNLLRKNILFITEEDNKVTCFETLFLPHNFMHLTGVKSDIRGEFFYRAALNNKLSVNDITLSKDGTTDLKLDVLPNLMSIHKTARMIGDYDHSRPLLVADKFAGTVAMVMGFIYVNNVYMPNSALKQDVRDITMQATRRKIIATFIKHNKDEKYRELTYIAKGLTIDDKIFKTIFHEKIDKQNLTASFPIPRKSLSD